MNPVENMMVLIDLLYYLQALKIGVVGAQKHVTEIAGCQSFGQRAAPDLVDSGK